MAVITTYECDKCGKKWIPGQDDEQPVAIMLGFDFGSTSIRHGGPSEQARGMWCRTCVMSMGMHPPMKKEDRDIAPVELTFEQKVIVLLNELGFYQAE